jgi:hypothetical protein
MPYVPSIPFTGNRNDSSYNRHNSLEAHGHGPQRIYSRGMGGSDGFYGRHYPQERADGWTGVGQGPWGKDPGAGSRRITGLRTLT